MKLQLDREAMFALFPEGSEAQVELRRAVIDAWVKHHVKKVDLTPEIESLIKEECVNIAKDQTKKLGDYVKNARDAWSSRGSFQLNSDVRYEIEQAAKTGIFAAINERIAKFTKEVIEWEINRIVRSKINEEVEKKVRERLEALSKGLLS